MIKLPSVLASYLSNIIIKASIISLLLFLTSFSNEKDQSSKIDPNVKIFDSNNSREKVYLHFDKPYYSSGDDIWFKVYLVNANSHQQNELSKIVYVDLIDLNHKIIDSKVISVENGCGTGDFKLDIKFDSGEYLVRAYTNYMRNFDHAYFFRKSFYITSILTNQTIDNSLDLKNSIIEISDINVKIEKPDIQFLPEGGNMVNNFPNRIGFKAIDSYGKGIDIQGVLLDNHGTKISAFKTLKFGLGKFLFIPEKGKSYRAHINYIGKDYYYDLPKALDNGIVMQVNEVHDNIRISLQSSLTNGINNLSIIGLQKGETVCKAKIIDSKNEVTVNFPKSIFDQGLVQFTLFDKTGNPLCERLVFVENETHQIEVNIKPSKDFYQKRELVEIDLTLNKKLRKILQAELSVAITDVSVINKDKYGMDIKSHLLLNSELKGEIENPGYYFIHEDPQRKMNLDILLMTQGWRKYLFTEELNDRLIQYKLEQGIIFKGTIIEDDNPNKTRQAQVSLFIKENEQILYDKIETDLDGHFEFGSFNIKDSASIIIQVEKVKRNDQYKSPRNQYSIVMDSIVDVDKPFISYNFKKNNQTIINDRTNFNHDYIERSKSFQSINSMFKNDKNRELLEEVIVEQDVIKTERELKKEEYARKLKINTALYKDPSSRLDFSDLGFQPFGNVLSIIRNRIPGVFVHGMDITIRGGSPLYLLNNVPTDNKVLLMSAQNIDFIDVLKGYKAAIYGSRASGGIIAIYTKNGTEKRFKSSGVLKNGILNFAHPGYYKGREFYEPKYATDKPEDQKPDYRSTLCWRPNIKLDAEGKAKISFYAADIPTAYRIDLQGITSDGIPIISEAYINIE